MSEVTRVYYNKLVRDNIPAKIEGKKEACEYRKISDVQELQQELFKKNSRRSIVAFNGPK